MPKRKNENDYDYIKKKLKRLEKKLRKTGRPEDVVSVPAADPPPLEVPDIDIVDAWVLSEEEAVNAPPPEQDTVLEQPIPSTSLQDIQSTSTSATAAALPHAVSTPPPVAEPTTAAPQAIDTLEPTTAIAEEIGLDADLLELLGTDPTAIKKYGKDVQKDLSIRLEHCAVTGLNKDLRKEFKERYLTPDNCKLIDPPELNAELKAAVSEIVTKRDKAIEGKQKQLSSAISCFAEAITLLMSDKEKNTVLLKLLIDGVRILCDCQHADTITRRNFLLNAVKKDMKDQLQNTKIDRFLFSESLAETLKSAKAINKSGADLKLATPKFPPKKPVPSTTNTPRSLNWKNPGPARRQQGPIRKEPTMTSTRGRPTNSYKPSLQRQPRSNYNRR